MKNSIIQLNPDIPANELGEDIDIFIENAIAKVDASILIMGDVSTSDRDGTIIYGLLHSLREDLGVVTEANRKSYISNTNTGGSDHV